MVKFKHNIIKNNLSWEYDNSLYNLDISLQLTKEIGDKSRISSICYHIAFIHRIKGNYEKALEYFRKSLEIDQEIDDKYGVSITLNNIGLLYTDIGDYNKAAEYLKKIFDNQNKFESKVFELNSYTHLYLSYKHLNKEYDEQGIYSLIKESENIEYILNYLQDLLLITYCMDLTF